MEPADILSQTIDVVTASERLLAIGGHAQATLNSIESAIEGAPSLAPELEQMKMRILEIAEHLLAAQGVLNESLSLIRDAASES